jgi:DNA-damage-inducible protein D
MSEIVNHHYRSFEEIKEVNEHGQEFWMARKLARVLDYADFRNFTAVIEKARKACENSGQDPESHFEEMSEKIGLGSSAEREMPSFALSRYACYLIVQNGDPSKPVIANGQTYFAMQTRKQELAEGVTYKALDEDGKRAFLRNELREHNRKLVATAKQAGVGQR